MDRSKYLKNIEMHFRIHPACAILGPRQVGKTTTSLAVKDDWGRGYYFNWNQLADRRIIVDGSQAIANEIELQRLSNQPPMVIFDEIITKDEKPWILVEVKNGNNKNITPSLHYFQSATGAPYSFQVVLDLPYVDKSCFEEKGIPIIVPAKTFLSQLV